MSMDESEYKENAQEYERTPEDFEADFDIEDTQVPDHPVVLDVEGMGKASAKLARWELIEDLQDDDGEAVEFDADQVARIIRLHYKSPDFAGLRGDDVRGMYLSTPDALLEAIMPGMEAQINPDGSAMVDTKNGGSS